MANRWDERPVGVTKVWLPGSLILFVALAVYCEVCTVLAGMPRPGIAVSGAWALQISVGWAVVGALLGTFGARVADANPVRRRPVAAITIAVLAIAAFTLACELVVAQVSGWAPDLLSLLGTRGPMSLAGSALLVAIFAARHRPPGERVRTSLEVMTGTGYVSIATAEIECLEADGNYVNVVHACGRTYLLRSTMGAAERLLGPGQFVRVHRSTIVNRGMIRERQRGGLLVLRSGRTVRIGRAFRDRLG